MPHGSDFNWNKTLRENLEPLLDRYKIAYAFSMADPKVIELAIKRLEKRGVRAIMLIRLYSLAASFREKTEYILGLNGAYRHGGKVMRVASPVVFTTFGGSEFKDIQYYTWWEDWQDKRKKSFEVIRRWSRKAVRTAEQPFLFRNRPLDRAMQMTFWKA